MRKILITNDDGIYSDGIARLVRVAVNFGEVWVVAPESERSAMSHSILIRDSIEVRPVEFPVPGVHAFACSGTPADCVRVGVLNIVPGGPDRVLSGINYGYNVGMDLQYSATAGAAFEAEYQGFHAIAFSEAGNPNHEVADQYLEEVLAELIDKPLERGEIWNVNFPGCGSELCRGVLRERTVSRRGYYQDKYDETPLDNGVISYQLHGIFSAKAPEGSDLKAVLEKYVSVGIARNIS